MKILVFTEGTIITHQKWAGLTRQEVIRRIQSGEIPDYAATMPIGEAAAKLSRWREQGAEILYLTSRRFPDQIQLVQQALNRFGFPPGQLLFRQEGESYGQVSERVMPNLLIEDDCESIGGELEMTYPNIRPDLKARIKAVIVREFYGIDHLPDDLEQLLRIATG